MTRWHVNSSPTYQDPCDLATKHVLAAMRRYKKTRKEPTSVLLGTRAYPTHASFRGVPPLPPYLFGMVINSEPSHKCHSGELCGSVGRLTRPNVSSMTERLSEAP